MSVAVDYGVIVKGGEDAWSVVLTDSAGWAAAAETTWVWKLLIGSRKTRTTLALAITATSATRTTVTDANDTMTMRFDITPVQSDTLDTGVYYVECEATEPGPGSEEHYYSGAWGELTVREPEAGG